MSKPWTFALLKPDAVANPISISWILDALHRKGLVIGEGCRLILSTEKASELYSAHKHAFFYSRLIHHVCSGPSVAMRLEFHGFGGAGMEGEENGQQHSKDLAIKLWRELLGPSKLFPNLYSIECKELDELSLRNCRQLFALSDTRNFAHGSDSLGETLREYFIFKQFMRKIDEPAAELFHLDKFRFDSEQEEMDERTDWNLLHQ